MNEDQSIIIMKVNSPLFDAVANLFLKHCNEGDGETITAISMDDLRDRNLLVDHSGKASLVKEL